MFNIICNNFSKFHLVARLMVIEKTFVHWCSWKYVLNSLPIFTSRSYNISGFVSWCHFKIVYEKLMRWNVKIFIHQKRSSITFLLIWFRGPMETLSYHKVRDYYKTREVRRIWLKYFLIVFPIFMADNDKFCSLGHV